MAARASSLSTADAMLAQQRRQRRRDRLLMMTLIELLAIMVFVAMAYALASRNEAEISTDWKAKYEASQRELADAKASIVELRAQVEEARAAAAALAQAYDGEPLPVNPDEAWAEVLERARTASQTQQQQAAAQQARIAAALDGKGAFGVPRCPVPTWAMTVLLYADDTLQAIPAWRPGEVTSVEQMPAIAELVGAGRISRDRFSALSSQVNIQSGKFDGCVLGVTARPAERYFHDLYIRQVNQLDQWFAVKRVGMDEL